MFEGTRKCLKRLSPVTDGGFDSELKETLLWAEKELADFETDQVNLVGQFSKLREMLIVSNDECKKCFDIIAKKDEQLTKYSNTIVNLKEKNRDEVFELQKRNCALIDEKTTLMMQIAKNNEEKRQSKNLIVLGKKISEVVKRYEKTKGEI